jgi:hypothetical protein
MSQACLIESLWPETECCCEGDAGAEKQPEPSCEHCVTLQTGANPTHVARIAVEMPLLVEDVIGSAVLNVSLAKPAGLSVWRVESPTESPPIWHLVARTSVPVRGPSFPA